MAIKIKNKRRFIISISLMALIFIFISKGCISCTRKILNGHSTKLTAGDITKGSITVEENSIFKRYVINYFKDVENKIYDDATFIYLDLSANIDLGIKTYSDKKSINAIGVVKQNGKKQLVIKKMFNNNYFYINKKLNYVDILVSKTKDPFKYSVVLDAGHGGSDPGTASVDRSMVEKDYALEIADMVKMDLAFKSCKVEMTRDEDKLLQLQEIADIANSKVPDAFVSIHLNFYKESSKESGIETYYYDRNKNSESSKSLADIVENSAISSDGWNNRGIKAEDFYVIKNTMMPAVLVECGYLSNDADKERLKNKKTIKNLAENISKGVCKYLENK